MKNSHLKAFFGVVSAAPILFLIGIAISIGIYLVWPIPLVHGTVAASILVIVGAVAIVLGTALAFLAQRVSRVVADPNNKASLESLMQGPYRYSRHPGSLAIGMMYVGFALVANSLILIIVAGFFLIIMTFVFVPLEEREITALCPEAYAEYKTKVRMWI